MIMSPAKKRAARKIVDDLMRFRIFNDYPLDRNLLVMPAKVCGAATSFWTNEIILEHYMFHNALVRIFDTDKSFEKITEALGGEYLEDGEVIADLSCQLVTIGTDDVATQQPASQAAKLWNVEALIRELHTEKHRNKIIIFDDLPKYIESGGADLLNAVIRLYREAPSCNGAVVTLIRSAEELEKLEKTGDTIKKLQGLVLSPRLLPEDIDKMRMTGFDFTGVSTGE